MPVPPSTAFSARAKMLLACALGTALGFPVIGSTLFGFFVVPLSTEFGWGRGDISVAYTLMGWLVAAGSPVLGFFLDRVGTRRVLLTSIALFAASIAGLAFLTNHLWHLYAMYVLVAICGLGTTPVSYSRAIVQWFDERRGIALGIGLSGIGLGSMLAPMYVNELMQLGGWRLAYLGLAALTLCISWPLCWLWIRNPPDARAPGRDLASSDELEGYPFAQVIQSRAFYLVLPGITFLGYFTGAISVHFVPLLRDRGADATSAALAVSLLGFAAVVGRLLGGWLIDRYRAPVVVGLVLCAPATGVLLLTLGLGGHAFYISAFLMGLGFGAEMDFLGYIVSRYLGLRSYGRTYGVLYGAMIAGLGTGSLLTGYVQQWTGSYDLALLILTAVTVAAIVPFTLLGPYPSFSAPEAPRISIRDDPARG